MLQIKPQPIIRLSISHSKSNLIEQRDHSQTLYKHRVDLGMPKSNYASKTEDEYKSLKIAEL